MNGKLVPLIAVAVAVGTASTALGIMTDYLFGSPFFGIILPPVCLSCYASFITLRSPTTTPVRKVGQILVVWLLPIVIVSAALLFLFCAIVVGMPVNKTYW